MAEDRGLFPFYALVGAMTMEGSELKENWGRKQELKDEGRIGSTLPATRK